MAISYLKIFGPSSFSILAFYTNPFASRNEQRKRKILYKKNKPLNILTTHLKSGYSNLICIAVVRTFVYNKEKDVYDKGELLWQSQQIYMRE